MFMKQGQRTGDTSSVAAKPRHLPLKGKAITVVEYVHGPDGELVRVDQLEPEQYERFRRWLGCTYLNELYRGKAEFYYPEATGRAAGGIGGSYGAD